MANLNAEQRRYIPTGALYWGFERHGRFYPFMDESSATQMLKQHILQNVAIADFFSFPVEHCAAIDADEEDRRLRRGFVIDPLAFGCEFCQAAPGMACLFGASGRYLIEGAFHDPRILAAASGSRMRQAPGSAVPTLYVSDADGDPMGRPRLIAGGGGGGKGDGGGGQ